MPLWIGVGLAFLLIFCVAVLFAVALGTIAQRADEGMEAQLERARLAAGLNRLSEVRSPSGRRFFPTSRSRHDLTEVVNEAFGDRSAV